MKAERTDCKRPFQFLKNINYCNPSNILGAHKAVWDALRRVQLYMGHEQRRYVQDKWLT